MATPGDEAEASRCTKCRKGEPSVGKAVCQRCLDRDNARRKELQTGRRANGLCPVDGRPLDAGKSKCHRCNSEAAKRERKRYAQRTEAGRCPRCGRDPDAVDRRFQRGPECRHCPVCFFSDTSRSHFGVRSFGRVLMEMFLLQGGRCALTGRELILGENTSLDHRTPLSRGGMNKVQNVQWTCRTANQGKGCLGNDEYVAECKLVVEWCASTEYAKIQRRLRRLTSRPDGGR